MRVALVALAILLSGCFGSSSSSGAEDSIAGYVGEPEPADQSGLSTSNCRGPYAFFEFDGQEASKHVREPFGYYGGYTIATGWTQAFGHLVHLRCEGILNGMRMAELELGFAVVEVDVPTDIKANGRGYYLLGAYSSSPEVVAWLLERGVPVVKGEVDITSAYAVGYTGPIIEMGPFGRLSGSVTEDGLIGGMSIPSHLFYHNGTEPALWSFSQEAQTMSAWLTPDGEFWGRFVHTSYFPSAYKVNLVTSDHVFEGV